MTKKLKITPQTVTVIKKKEETKVKLSANRIGECNRKIQNTPGGVNRYKKDCC